MVTFKLIHRTDTELTYHYYPEDDRDKDFGVICFDLSNKTYNIRKTAEKDFTRVRKKEELNELRDCINKMRLENGKSELTEDELPTVKEDVIITYYADVVIHAVWDSYKRGTVLESGSRVWY